MGVVHHDLKPSNVLLVPDAERPGGERVVVLDFGLAPLVAAGLPPAAPAYVAPELWTRGEVAADGAADAYALGCLAFQLAVGRPPGAPAYVAPELWTRGEIAADAAADAYALGCLAFQLAVGRPPFVAPMLEQLREKHLHDPAPSIRSLMPDTGTAMDNLVARMLEKRPADRLRAMKDVAKLFDLLVGQDAPLGETVRD